MTARHLYRIIRGQYSRKEGDKKAVHYQAKTADNLDVKDEMYLSPKEARALGHKVRPLNPSNIVTGLPETSAVPFPATGPVAEPRVIHTPRDQQIATLITDIDACDTSAKLAVCRRKILSMGIVGDLPYSKPGIIKALLALINVG